MARIFGMKVGNINHFGKKVVHGLNVVGRKTLNTIDKVAPIASTVAMVAGRPDIADAINQGQDTAHKVDGAVRAGAKVLGGKQRDIGKNMIEFGEKANEFKEKRNDLLRT